MLDLRAAREALSALEGRPGLRRIDEIAGAMELQDWYEVLRAKPKGMRAARYVQLVQRRQRLLAQLASHLARRRRLRGNNKKYLHETMLALGR